MVVSRDKTPSAQETFLQMAQAAGLRGRLLITIALLILVRLGIFIPIPGIDRRAFTEAISNSPVLGFLDIFTGGGISTIGIFALGILPYINASIILQLLTAAVPALEDLQKNEGEAGRRKNIPIYSLRGGRLGHYPKYWSDRWLVASLCSRLWPCLYCPNDFGINGGFFVCDVDF